MAEVNIRGLALTSIMEVMEEQVHCDTSLHSIWEANLQLTKQQRSFLARLVEGTVERCIELDYILNRFSKVKVKKMKPVVRNILRMGVYQLKYMDSVPPSAACNEAVKLAVKKGFNGLRGYVNGVLRAISRDGLCLDYRELLNDEILQLSVLYSMPEWLVSEYISWFGREEAEQIFASYYEERALTLAVNRFQTDLDSFGKELDAAGIVWEADTRVPGALKLIQFPSIQSLPGYEEGKFFVQDISSQMAVSSAGILPGDTVVDVCGAPGGKSLFSAMLAGTQGKVSVRDLTKYKVNLIQENIRRLGMSGVEAKVFDARDRDEPWIQKADVVIADVPCSGLGVIGKKPDIKYHITSDSVRELVSLQREIVSRAGEYVKPGGHLLYSTCTIRPEENTENRRWIESNLHFRLEEERTFLPGVEDTDGFYYARFVSTQLA